MKHAIERTALPWNEAFPRRFFPAAGWRSWVSVLIFLFPSLTGLNLRADTWTETKKTVFIIRVDFSDLTGAFLTKSEIETIYNTGASNQILEMSYGKTWVEATASVATVRMPSPKGVYLPNNYNLLHDDARAAFNALGTGINLASYDVVCVLHKNIGMPYVGFTAGTRMWIQGSVTIEPNVVTHEMGHVYGLSHAQAWQTSDGSVVGPGSSIDYGDVFDRMGGVQTVGGHFNMQYKSQLNWLTTAQWTAVSASGTYRIHRFDHPSTTASTSRALRVTKAASPAEYYWVGYRRAIPSNQYLANGAYLIWQQPGSSLSHLLDATPGSAGGITDAALLIGRTYSDSTANVRITPIAKGGSGADEWLDITVNVGTFPGNSAPTSGAINGPTSLTARTPATYSVSASDPNSDTLAYFWDFGDGIPAINAASATHAFPIGGSHTVRVVVSDMKGLTVTQTLAVTVSEPLTQWTARTSGTAANLQDICVGANGAAVPIALAVGVDQNNGVSAVCTSTNGSNWTSAEFLPDSYGPGYPSELTGVTYDGQRFIACGSGFDPSPLNYEAAGIWTSTNGSAWTRRYKGGASPALHGVATNGTTSVVVGDSGLILYSTNGGTTWTVASNTATGAFYSVAWGGGSFVAVGDKFGPGQVFTSPNGITWTNTTSGAGLENPGYNFSQVRYCKDRFLATGYGARIRHSTDGGASFQSTRSTFENTPGFAFGNGAFLAAGLDNNSADANLVSTDGATWTQLTTTSQNDRNAATFFQNTFITVGQAGSIWQSAISPAQSALPTAITQTAASISSTGATFNGSVNPNGTASTGYFQWGTTSSYGNTTASVNLGSGTSAVPLSTAITGLTNGVTYHFRAVISNSVAVVYGEDLTFTAQGGAVAPTLTTLAATLVTNTTATLNGSANPNGTATTGYFQWGTTTSYGNTTASVDIGSGTSAVALSAAISGLTPGVTYHFRAVGNNSAGTVNGADFTFTTAQPPSVTTSAATLVTNTTATLNGSANPNGTASTGYFQWGTTTSYGNTTASVNIGSGTSAVALTAAISGLTPGVTYHFRAVANNSAGTVNGADFTFTATQPPSVTTLAATLVTNTTATLNGSANPNGTASTGYFQWGTTTSYGNTTASVNIGSGTSAVALSAGIIGLTPGVTYHFRAVASSSAGTVNGNDATFFIPVDFSPTARTFSGGDPGEGLDLQGTFVYAVNVGGNGAPGLIGNANFTADNVPGVSVTAPGGTLNTIDAWSAPNFGSTTNDDRLEQAMRSIRWTNAPAKLTVSLANLQAGRSHKLQLLFIEQSPDRAFDVKVNGATVLTGFRTQDYGPFATPLVVTHTFTTPGTTALIEMGGAILPLPQDGNPILSAFTLEDLGGASFNSLTIAPSGSNAVLSWPAPIRGVLQETLNLVPGMWNYSPSGTTNPATVAVTGIAKFYRLALSPTNDDFAGRTLLGATPFTMTASNVGATKEAGEPIIAGNVGGRSLWWSWTAPVTGTVTISLKGSSFDTLLGVYTGTAINGLTQIAFNDDFDGNQYSQITFAATQNVTYQIAVDGFNNGPGIGAATGIIQMTLTP